MMAGRRGTSSLGSGLRIWGPSAASARLAVVEAAGGRWTDATACARPSAAVAAVAAFSGSRVHGGSREFHATSAVFRRKRGGVKSKKATPKAEPLEFPLDEAWRLVRSFRSPNMARETVDLAIRLNVDPKRVVVRASILLPHDIGRTTRVAVFAEGAEAEAALAAGADVVGGSDLVDAIAADGSSAIAFEKALSTPSFMPKLGRIARTLGPRGLMPNAKRGTVTTDLEGALRGIKNAVDVRADRYGIVHVPFGHVDFSDAHLENNLYTIIDHLMDLDFKTLQKGKMLKTVFVSSVHGPGIPLPAEGLDPLRNQRTWRETVAAAASRAAGGDGSSSSSSSSSSVAGEVAEAAEA